MLKYATFASLFLLSFLPSSIVLADSQFSQSCSNITLDRGRLLEANCRTNNGGHAQTGINLNDYIGNDNGKLKWARNGHYIATSQHCELDHESGRTFLHCDTRKENGNWISSTLDLDRRIVNNNGQLAYQRR